MSNGTSNDDSDNGKDPDPTVESDPVKPPHLLWAAAAGGLIGGLIGALIGSGLS
ncbi:MAG TPA: hypothetical protein VLB75_03080 [Steroidobacteraceae bacterium]|nr:hypothetical protein [Steroidobacteraceae bacterium]